jgi:hypothetical protein
MENARHDGRWPGDAPRLGAHRPGRTAVRPRDRNRNAAERRKRYAAIDDAAGPKTVDRTKTGALIEVAHW